jgi:class 3 adenylate cyclase
MARNSKAVGKRPKSRSRKTKALAQRKAHKIAFQGETSAANPDPTIAKLAQDLEDALERQTATTEVLGLISSSSVDLESVFQSILANAIQICRANFGFMHLFENGAARIAGWLNVPEAFMAIRNRSPIFHFSPSHPLGRLFASKKTQHILDARKDQAYAEKDSLFDTFVDLTVTRTIVFVPILNKNALLGSIGIFRQEVNPFTDRQIDLVRGFCAQAAIAIENARLFRELRDSYGLVQQQAGKLEAQSLELTELNKQLEQRVADQVTELERMSRLRRFLPPQVADLIVASGTEKQLESHRRDITALFCDLRGFTRFTESADAEDVITLLREYHAAIGEKITKYSGTLERYAGDGVMVVFNDPVPIENPQLLAVLMALEVRDAIGQLTSKWRRFGHDIDFGIGIAHGYATLGTIGFEGRFDYAAIGTVSNVASRLCDEAKPGQILISQRVLVAVEDAITVEPAGEFELKGIRQAMPAYNVLAANPSHQAHDGS